MPRCRDVRRAGDGRDRQGPSRPTRAEIARAQQAALDAQKLRCDPGPARALLEELRTMTPPRRVVRAMARLARQLDARGP
jgi:hypothetical protein